MQPIQIILNGQHYQIGQTLPADIKTCSIAVIPIPIPIQTHQVSSVKQWLNQLIDNLTCTYIEFNGILIPVSDINKFNI